MAMALLALAGCAPTTSLPSIDLAEVKLERDRQADAAVRRAAERQHRVQSIGWRLRLANVALCPERTPVGGFIWRSVYDWPRDFQPAARRTFGVTGRPTITYVHEDSPADVAGLQAGDIVLVIDGRPLSGRTRDQARNRNAIARAGRDGVLRLRVQRGDTIAAVDITLAPACASEVFLLSRYEPNAYADGDDIMITDAMLNLLSTDEELALVLAHELAHNTEGHVSATQANMILGGALGLAFDAVLAANGVNSRGAGLEAGLESGALAYSADFEREADYVSLYFMARAGYALDGVEEVWRRLGEVSPGSITRGRTHPTTPERVLNLIAARQEIEAKLASGAPLEPERRR